MISFERVNKKSFTNPTGLRVRPEQEEFVGRDLAAHVQGWRDDRLYNCFLILKSGMPVGFFALDRAEERHRAYIHYDMDYCVLRCFFIDERHQGQGIATQALEKLPKLARELFPNLANIYLTVNERNEVAYKLYAAAGFNTLTQRYLGGAAGPQRVMVLKI